MTWITLGFSRPRSFFNPLSYIIRSLEGTPFSHCYIKFYSKTLDRFLYYEATHRGVNFIGSRIFEKIRIVDEISIRIPENNQLELLRFCVDNSGTKYGVLQLFGMLYAFLYKRLTGKSTRNPFADGRHTQVCSELIGIIIRDILVVPIQDDLDTVGVKRIYEIARSLKDAGQPTPPA